MFSLGAHGRAPLLALDTSRNLPIYDLKGNHLWSPHHKLTPLLSTS
jgi:hypothetical protein